MTNARHEKAPLRPGLASGPGGVTATWWYTVLSALFFAVSVLFVWFWIARATAAEAPALLVLYVAGALVWLVALSLALRAPWRAEAERPSRVGRSVTLAVAGVAAVSAGFGAGSVTLALALVVGIGVLSLPRGVRGRVTVVATLVVAAGAIIESTAERFGAAAISWLVPFLFATALPGAIVSTLWWWEIVRELDRSRAAQARLAAVRERLRLADDVHDLQGHHLQVIALQLELAQRLLMADPEAALRHLADAQRSVDDARAGTRALATRFRGVPLPDELANAVDLLRAAGVDATLDVSADADAAPREALGPVVREATTNILKHGGGAWARLSLHRDDGRWRFRAANDAPAPVGVGDAAEGSGLHGMANRIAQAGGEFSAAARTSDPGAAAEGAVAAEFVLQAAVPDEGEPQ